MKDRALLHVREHFYYGTLPIKQWIKSNLPGEKNQNILSVILAFAILANDPDSTKLLIEKGADIHLECYDGKSPYQLSFECSLNLEPNANEVKEIIIDAHKAAHVGRIVGKPNLKPSSLLFMSAKAASKNVLEISSTTNIGFFKNIPERLAKEFAKNDYQKIIIAASEYADMANLESDDSQESFKNVNSNEVINHDGSFRI